MAPVSPGLLDGASTDGRNEVISRRRIGSVSVRVGSDTVPAGGRERSGLGPEESTRRANSASSSSAFACWLPGARDRRPTSSRLFSANRSLETLRTWIACSRAPHARRRRRNQGQPPSATSASQQGRGRPTDPSLREVCRGRFRPVDSPLTLYADEGFAQTSCGGRGPAKPVCEGPISHLQGKERGILRISATYGAKRPLETSHYQSVTGEFPKNRNRVFVFAKRQFDLLNWE